MRAIMVMYDSLNRRFLPPYGNSWVHAPNFKRLAERTVTFDTSYIGSMPCMPARREWQTGRPNFLHRSWGPLEPYDDSVPELLRKQGVYSHLTTDHYHYWEDGGATYHSRYNTYEFHRGQEGDPCIGQVADPYSPPSIDVDSRSFSPHWRQDWINRSFMRHEEDMPQTKTFRSGLDFIQRNAKQDNWFLHLETFDPHEPFFVPKKYRDLYPNDYKGPHFDWPPYRKVSESPEQVEHLRRNYAGLVSMCDASLGLLLDTMDELNMWDDTMLIVWTDHGFLLGEHGWWAKVVMPYWEEIARTPLFVWDPRSRKAGERRASLVQPAMDLGPTLLDFFNVPPTPDMLGKPLRDVIATDAPARDAAIFGSFGTTVNVTDGRYVYMRGVDEKHRASSFRYWLMPTNMRNPFTPAECAEASLAGPFRFTKGLKLVRTPQPYTWGPAKEDLVTRLYDLAADPAQETTIHDPVAERRMIDLLVRMMAEADAPAEKFERLGLAAPVGLSLPFCPQGATAPRSDSLLDCSHMSTPPNERPA